MSIGSADHSPQTELNAQGHVQRVYVWLSPQDTGLASALPLAVIDSPAGTTLAPAQRSLWGHTAQAGRDVVLLVRLWLGHTAGDYTAYLHTNHLGAPELATDQGGQVIWQARYSPFGTAQVKATEGFTLQLRLRHQHEGPMNWSAHMERRNWLALWLGFISSSCSGSGLTVGFGSPRFGVIVSVLLVKGFNTKYGVELSSDTGRYLMAPAELNSRGGSAAGFGGTGLPKWVEVRWRTGHFIQRFDPETNSVWTGGTVTGNHRIEVASRIPPDVIRYASVERGRAIKLMFRILDDAVVLGWCVQEPPKVGGGWVFSHFGGDFKPAKWFNGQVVEPGWYVDPATGQRVATTTGH